MQQDKSEPISVNVKGQQAPQPQPEQPQQREVPIERILARYGRTHLMLVEAEEELARGRTLVQHFQQKFAEAATRIASLTDDLATAHADLAKLQERLAQYEQAREAENEKAKVAEAAN